MNITLTQEQKKSIAITALFCALLLLALIFIKFASATKIQELAGGGGGGISINFGDSDVGMGEDYTSKVLQVADQKATQPTTASAVEDILTQDSDDAIGIPPTKVNKADPKKVVTNPVPAKPRPSKETSSTLDNLLNGNNKGSDGDDGVAGNKGKSNGSTTSGDYSGNGGSGGGTGGGNGSGNGPGSGSGSGPGSGGGSGGGYSLGNRKALVKPAPNYTCNESGQVVIEVTVDRSGRTIGVVRAKGTTNTAACLVDQAKIAARNTKWAPDPNAPEKQVGKIIYTFSLN
ncbi:MAG TPA: energy transducer TonB [Flavobacterium sp.]|jgi:outer membrane biosynthesis protein TonB